MMNSQQTPRTLKSVGAEDPAGYAALNQTANEATIFGERMLLDDANWHFVFIWPHSLEEKGDSEMQKPQQDPIQTARKYFTKRGWEGSGADHQDGFVPACDMFRENMTKEEFQVAVRAAIVEFLSGVRMGFKLETMKSIDEDEVFLLVELPKDSEALVQIANHQEVRMPVRPELYENIGVTCPTLTYDVLKNEFKHVHETDLCPMHLPFKTNHRHKFQDFDDKMITRIMRHRMQEFLNLSDLVYDGVITDVFPVHRWLGIHELNESGWSNMTLCQKVQLLDPRTQLVRNYFGEEVAFFFHWFNFYTYFLMAPAILAAVMVAVDIIVGSEAFLIGRMLFAGFMCLWASLFNKVYSQRSKLRIEQWGMRNWDAKASVRPSFNQQKEGSWAEFFQNGFHWVLVSIFILQTVLVTANLSWLQAQANKDPEASWNLIFFSTTGSFVGMVSKLCITVNIKLVDFIWLRVSPKLAEKENWKTNQQKKNQMLAKLFLVKFMVNYYPFFYLAFIKRFVEDVESDECMKELRSNLLLFFVFHMLSNVLAVGIPIFFTRRAVSAELDKVRKEKPDAQYTYLQLQAKCPKHEGDTEDMMELITSLGHIMMFSSVAPEMVLLAIFSNVLEIRIEAYKMCNVMRRAQSTGQEGIGAWAPILQVMSGLGVISNVAIACFEFHPFGDDVSLQSQLIVFILMEHLLLSLKIVIEMVVPERDRTLQTIQEVNENCVDEMFDYSFHEVVKALGSPDDEKVHRRTLSSLLGKHRETLTNARSQNSNGNGE